MNQDQQMSTMVYNVLRLQSSDRLDEVVQFFSQDMIVLHERLRDQLGGAFTADSLNLHPICIMYASKITNLTHTQYGTHYRDAQEWCNQVWLSKIGDPLPPLPLSKDAATF